MTGIYQCGLVQERIAGDVLSLARIQLDMLSLHHVETDIRQDARQVSNVDLGNTLFYTRPPSAMLLVCRFSTLYRIRRR